ncbi:MAG: hypothetical protein Alis3KO_35790 [Aliiglaciecola sp.]
MNRVFYNALLAAAFALSKGAIAQQMVDPTQPQDFIPTTAANSEASGGATAIIISAVFINGERKTAVINGDTVTEGQTWQGNKVKKVHKGGVVLVMQGRETELFINQHSIKKDASNDF